MGNFFCSKKKDPEEPGTGFVRQLSNNIQDINKTLAEHGNDIKKHDNDIQNINKTLTEYGNDIKRHDRIIEMLAESSRKHDAAICNLGVLVEGSRQRLDASEQNSRNIKESLARNEYLLKETLSETGNVLKEVGKTMKSVAKKLEASNSNNGKAARPALDAEAINKARRSCI